MIPWGLLRRIHWAATKRWSDDKATRHILGCQSLLAIDALAEENGHSSNRVGASARSAIRYALPLTLALEASLVLTTAAMANPTPDRAGRHGSDRHIVEDCEGSVAPSRSSKNEIKITATTEDGTLLASRNLKCNK